MTDPTPFLRGCVWPATAEVPYPRVDPADARRLPLDTWTAAAVPAGVRLELVGSATHVDVEYRTATDQLGYRGAGAGCTFDAWRGDRQVDVRPAVLGRGTARLELGAGDARVVVYLPEGMKPTITAVHPVGGDIAAPPAQLRWIAYGDSITEGWSSSSPARSWVAVAGRESAMDTVNLGYAGAARGELAVAQQIAELDADVITVAYGTNCWTTIPHSADMMRANTAAFLHLVRSAHPRVPMVVVSPLIRPDAEDRPNALGTTLAELRAAIEHAVTQGADPMTLLLPGADLVPAELLTDGIHPGDEGHRMLAKRMGAELQRLSAG
jgi:lysophospholipase L1-like esterase